jgi:hypothetical protein
MVKAKALSRYPARDGDVIGRGYFGQDTDNAKFGTNDAHYAQAPGIRYFIHAEGDT